MALVIIFAIAAMALTLGRAMRTEVGISANAAAMREASLVERGAEQYVIALLAEAKATGEPVESLDQSYFEAVQVGSGCFWIVRPDYGDPLLPAFGLVDESGKIDLNTVSYVRLMRVPGMTVQLAAAIIDWRDEDEEVTLGFGAESSTYLGRTPSYEAKNAPFESVEELSLVYGWAPDLIYGSPEAPPLGMPGAAMQGGFVTELWQIKGFFDLFTVWSAAPTTAPDGRQRLDVDGEEEPLRELVTEIIGGSRAEEINGELDDAEDLFEFALEAGITADELRQLEPYLMVAPPPVQVELSMEGNVLTGLMPQDVIRGRVNVNNAPREVLLSVEELDEGQVDQIISQRQAYTQQYPGSMTWLMELFADEAEGMGEELIAGGSFYSADIIAASGNGRAFRRVRIVVDTSGDAPQIVYRRDLTEQGWPMDPQILESLRRGEGIPATGGNFAGSQGFGGGFGG